MADQRLLDPKVLARLNNIELVAKTVVDGFLTGLHRAPFFGSSLEFAEYRPYAIGDDPRFIDWNVFSRTDRTYVRRYLGETNTHLAILFDASASMGYGANGIKTWPPRSRTFPFISTMLSVLLSSTKKSASFDPRQRGPAICKVFCTRSNAPSPRREQTCRRLSHTSKNTFLTAAWWPSSQTSTPIRKS